MKNLWTPCGMSYTLGHEKKAARYNTWEELLLYRDEYTLVFLNRFPFANTLLLVVPSRHPAELTELNENDTNHLIGMIRKSTAALKKYHIPDDFNIELNLGETAYAGLADHLHFHIISRRHSDPNFMTTVAAIRTIQEHSDQTYARLLGDFQTLPATETGDS